jgi:Domain of unknown function (DUF222)/HNH endonuclease
MFVDAGELDRVPLGRLEQEITTLAGHINAATCRFLELVGEFDRRAGWGESGCASCVEWLSWRCGLAPRAAREHVRVASRLRELPRVREVFARGELSFSQVRAICRVADEGSEEMLVDFARHATAAHLERIVGSFRGVLARELSEVNRAYEERYLVHHVDEDGSLVLQARLPAEDGATVLAALAAGREALWAEERQDGSAEPLTPPRARNVDALVLMAESLLADPATRPGGERHQLVVHVDAATLAHDAPDGACHVENGPALHPETARRLGCDAGVVRMLEADGKPLSVGRRTRTVSPALRRALRSRDHGCRFPGCSRTRFVDAHHIHHWAHGGLTKLDNLVTLCRHHHRLVHEGGFSVVAHPGGKLRFHRPDGRAIPVSPARPRGDHSALARAHRARHLHVDPQTAVSRWNGDRLDVHATTDALGDADRRLNPDRAPPG